MRSLLILSLAAAAAAQPSLRITPALATDCSASGKATITLQWTAREPTQIRILTGTATVQMTGDLPLTGSTRSGAWVTDGLVFVLTTPAGAELARAQARVLCVTPSPQSFFPLQTGYEWTYRIRTRQVTGNTLQLRVLSAAEVNGEAWFEVQRDTAAYGWFRNDDQGRVWRRDRLDAPARIWLDPSAAPRRVLNTPLGDVENVVDAMDSESLNRTRRSYAPGIGLVALESSLLTGSSGGLTEAWDLAAFRHGAAAREEANDAKLELAAESRQLDVTNRQVSNCAVPCYFTACGLVPGADPPGTYRPCFRAHATAGSATPGARIELRLLDAAGAVLFQAAQPLTSGLRLQRQVPIQQPPGRYTLEARILGEGSAVEQTATLPLTVN